MARTTSFLIKTDVFYDESRHRAIKNSKETPFQLPPERYASRKLYFTALWGSGAENGFKNEPPARVLIVFF